MRLERGGGGRCSECGASSCLCLGEEMREELPCPALAPPLRVRACGEALLHLSVVHLSVGTSATCATSSSATRAGWAPSGSPPEGASCSRTRRPARRPRATVARRRAPRSSEGRGGRSGELRELEAGGGVLRCRRASHPARQVDFGFGLCSRDAAQLSQPLGRSARATQSAIKHTSGVQLSDDPRACRSMPCICPPPRDFPLASVRCVATPALRSTPVHREFSTCLFDSG